MIKRIACIATLLLGSLAARAETNVIMLGTSTPTPELGRAGAGVAIVVNGHAYQFDAGGGTVKRDVDASISLGFPELTPENINYLFLTHLHSDHIQDVYELATSRWWSRKQRLTVYGPKGLEKYLGYLNQAASIEADIRAAGTPKEIITDRHGYEATAHEIEDGVVFQNDDIKVEAFTVPHGQIKPAFGYRVTTPDKVIVLSGDTSYSEKVAEMAKGVDILIHEVASGDQVATKSEFWQRYHHASHTMGEDVGRIATMAQPKLLVLYHIQFYDATPKQILEEVHRTYKGEVILANDLDMF